MAERREPPQTRLLWTVVSLLVVAAASVWGASRLTWMWSLRFSDLRGPVVDSSDGASREPALVPLALLYLAAAAPAVAVAGWARRVIGVLVCLAGIGVLWLGLPQTGRVFGPHPSEYPVMQVISGHLLAVFGGILAVMAGLLLVFRDSVMPRIGARYQAPATARHAANQDRRMWDALSEGQDPTED